MKKTLCLVLAVVMSLSTVVPAFAYTLDDVLRMNGCTTGESNAATLSGYTTRIEGTLTQRGNDFFYVLPDGTDLKNGFVDGDYFCWTGVRVKNYPKTANQAIYNTAYNGADYTKYPYEGTDSWVTLDYTDFKLKGIDANIVQSSFAWMDTVAQHAVTLPERDRAIYIADAVANKLSYGTSVSDTNTSAQSCQDNYIYAAYSGIGRCMAYGELYSAICRKSGLAVTNVFGDDAVGVSHMWNYVRVDGQWYFTDATYYDNDRSSAYVLQKDLFPGYTADSDSVANSIKGF